MFWIILVIVLLVIGILAALVISKGGFRFPWLQFYVKGKESGFSFKEVNLLRRLAVRNKLRTPTSLFWSVNALDRCIRNTIQHFKRRNALEKPENSQYLGQLFEFRKRVEFSQPKYRLGLSSTRSINSGQPLKITFPGGGTYYSTVVENIRRYLAISYPKGRSLPAGFTWHGQRISVYFWRPDDAGYSFESKVVGDFLDRKFPILHISHSDDLTRSQKRGSVRRELKQQAVLFPLRSIHDANEYWESSGGYRCKAMDISEDGIAVVVGGKAKPGITVKVQTRIDNEPVVMCGTVKGVSHKQKNNLSILHVQSVPPSPKLRNTILTYVYGIFDGEDSQ